MQVPRCGIEWPAWDGRLCRCHEGALHAGGGVGIHERAIQGAGRHTIGSSAGAQAMHWLGNSSNTRHVNTMQERRAHWLRGSEAVWVQKGADVWCVGSCAAAEKGALGSLKEAAVGVPRQGAGWRGVGLVIASAVLGGMDMHSGVIAEGSALSSREVAAVWLPRQDAGCRGMALGGLGWDSV
jgi:hypothetical protein